MRSMWARQGVPVLPERPEMFERLQQPISFRRKPSGEDSAPAPAAAERPSGRFARLNQPIGGKRPTAAPAAVAPAAPASEGENAAPAPVQMSAPRRMPRRSHRAQSLVGLEIEPGQLVAAKSHVNGRLVVAHAVGRPLPPNLVRDGEVTDL